MTTVDVERFAADGLSMDHWRFFYFDREHTLRVSSYYRAERPTARHKYRPVVKYSAHMRSDIAVPPLPSDVAEEAVRRFTEGLTASTWEGR